MRARREMAGTQTKMHTYCILHTALQQYSNMCSNMHVEKALYRPKADTDTVALALLQQLILYKWRKRLEDTYEKKHKMPAHKILK